MTMGSARAEDTSQIRGANFVAFANGDHVWVRHDDETMERLQTSNFLTQSIAHATVTASGFASAQTQPN